MATKDPHDDTPKPGQHTAPRAKTRTTREAMDRLHSSPRLQYFIEYGRWLAVQIALKEGTVHSREVLEELERAGILEGYTGGRFFLGSIFNKFPAFEDTGRTHKYSDAERNVHERTVKVWRLVKGFDVSTITAPVRPKGI